MRRLQQLMALSLLTTIGGCQSAPKVIPGYTRIEQPSGLHEVRFLAKGIE